MIRVNRCDEGTFFRSQAFYMCDQLHTSINDFAGILRPIAVAPGSHGYRRNPMQQGLSRNLIRL